MDSSPLNELSAELRNQIYELVLVQEDPIIITANDYSSDIRTINLPAKNHPLALLSTCKQINNESTSLFYGSNSFRFEFLEKQTNENKDELCLVQRFCASIGNAALVGLRDIHVHAGRTSVSRHIFQDELMVHSRNLLGLQGISVLNNELSIKYTIQVDAIETWVAGVPVKYVTRSIRLDDLENTLGAEIAWLQDYKPIRGWNPDLRDALQKELQYFQMTIFGQNEAPSRYMEAMARLRLI